MKLENSQKRISELMSRFVAQIENETSMGKTDLNKTAETILIPLLNGVYGWNLKNINYAEENNNFPGIDLADEVAGISIQVTATPTPEKVKHTLEQFIKHSQYLKYDRLIIYILTNKRDSYPEKTIQKIIQNRFKFDIRKDIWDRRNILKEVSSFQIDKTLRVQEILEANFGGGKHLSAVGGLENKINWRETCRELLEQWKGLTTNALTVRNGVRFQLDEIFVPLGVVERRQASRHSPVSGSPEQGSELYEEKVTPISQDDFFEQVLRQQQSKNSQGSRIAITGEPGAGKTTQLQKIGDWILNETDGIPIWVPLAAVGTKSLKEYLLNDWLHIATEELEIPQQYRHELGQLLKTGKVWLLLDGVDEMTVADALQQIATQMHEGWLRNVRVVLTCRLNVWEAGKNALDSFDVYRNLDFDYPSEVHLFTDRWFATEPNLQQKLKVALEQPGKERIRDMVKNPLRLTLLCYSWQLRQGELPETKAGLYEWFVDTFYEWNKGKVSTKLGSAKRKELNGALGELAKEAIDQESSRFRMREKFINSFLGDADDEGSLFYLARELGWLNRVGVAEENPLEDVYAFFHPTFQEYFAALAIDDWSYFLKKFPHNPLQGSYRCFEPQWKEVILLWLGQKNVFKASKEEFMSEVIDFDQSRRDFFGFRANFLAVEFLAEFPECTQCRELILKIISWTLAVPYKERNPVKEIVLIPEEHFDSKFVYISRVKDVSEDYLIVHYLDWIQEAAIESLLKTNRRKLTEILIEIAYSYNSRFDHTPIYLLGKIARGNELAIACIADSLKNDPEGEKLGIFYEEMEESFGKNHPLIIKTLIDLIENPPKEDLSLAISSLGEVASNHPLSIKTLFNVVQKYKIDYNAFLAVISLIKIDKNNSELIPCLLSVIDGYMDSWYEYVDVWNDLDDIQDELMDLFHAHYSYAISELTKFIQTSTHELKLCLVAELLGKIHGNNLLVKKVLIGLIDKTTKKPLLRTAVEILESIEPGNPTMVELLVKEIKSFEDSTDVELAIDCLGSIAKTNAYAINALLELSISSESDETQIKVAEELLNLSQYQPAATKILLKLIQEDKQGLNIVGLCKKLVRTGVCNKQIISCLRNKVKTSENAWECLQALEVLIELEESIGISFNDFLELVTQIGRNGIFREKFFSKDWIFSCILLNTEETIRYFKSCLIEEKHKPNFELLNTCFEIIWYCAQNMSYQDFYRAWHSSSSTDANCLQNKHDCSSQEP